MQKVIAPFLLIQNLFTSLLLFGCDSFFRPLFYFLSEQKLSKKTQLPSSREGCLVKKAFLSSVNLLTRVPYINLNSYVGNLKFPNRMSSIIPIAALNRLQLGFPEKLTDCYWVKLFNLVID